MYIYVITNQVNGKKYVGQTIQRPADRWQRHMAKSIFATAITKAMWKYGKDSFKFEVVDTANSLEELNEKEKRWIKELGTFGKGYNLTEGGSNGKRSNSTKGKISKKLMGIKRPYFEKPVICVNTGEEFASQRVACEQLGLRVGTISESIRKGYKVNRKLIFKYKEI